MEPSIQLELTLSKVDETTNKDNNLQEDFTSSSAKAMISPNKHDESAIEFLLEPNFQIDKKSNKDNNLQEDFPSTSSAKELISPKKHDAIEYLLESSFQIKITPSTDDGQTTEENSLDGQSTTRYNKTM